MTPSFAKKRTAALALVKRIHSGQMRGDGTEPAWHHLDRVSRVLEHILDEESEGTKEEREVIHLSALGHDSLEDTTVTRKELEKCFGMEGTKLIQGMTNTLGDHHDVRPYVKQICASAEGVRLIKLADLYDNCTSVSYGLFALGVKWTRSFFLPIVEPMVKAVTVTKFSVFPRSSDRLKILVRSAHRTLLENVERYEAK